MTKAKKSGAGNPPPDWTAIPHDPVERWIEARGYYREMARQAKGEGNADAVLARKGQFDFAESQLAECRAEMHGPSARLIALEEVWTAIGGRLLSSVGERHLPPNSGLGILRDSSIASRIGPEIQKPILELFGGFARLVRALLPGQQHDAASAVADARENVQVIEAALSELVGVAAATRLQATRSDGGHKSALTRQLDADDRRAEIREFVSKHPGKSQRWIAGRLGYSASTVCNALKPPKAV